MIGLKNSRHFFHPIRNKTKTNHNSLTHVFPRFASAASIYYEFWLVDWIFCVLNWLARVITLVLVSRHSVESHSNIQLAVLMSKRCQLQYTKEFLLKLKECRIFFPLSGIFSRPRKLETHEPVIFSYVKNKPLIALTFIWNIILTYIYALEPTHP